MTCKIERIKKQRFEHSGMKILKVNKLDKKENYSLISHEDGYVLLESERGKILVKFPTKMARPEPTKNWILKFNAKTSVRMDLNFKIKSQETALK